MLELDLNGFLLKELPCELNIDLFIMMVEKLLLDTTYLLVSQYFYSMKLWTNWKPNP